MILILMVEGARAVISFCIRSAIPGYMVVVVQVGLLLGLDLDDGVKEVLVGDEATLPPESDHAGLHTHCFTLGSVKVICTPGKLLVVDVGADIHLPGVDLHNPGPGLLCGGGELNFSVQTT